VSSAAGPSRASGRAGRLSLFKGLLTVDAMTRDTRTELLKTKLRMEISKVNEAIADCEVRIALPPADCRHLDLFIDLEETQLRFLKESLSDLVDRLARLEGQFTLALS